MAESDARDARIISAAWALPIIAATIAIPEIAFKLDGLGTAHGATPSSADETPRQR